MASGCLSHLAGLDKVDGAVGNEGLFNEGYFVSFCWTNEGESASSVIV